MTFNTQIPSQEVIIAREMYLSAQKTLTITVPSPNATTYPAFARTVRLMYGKTDAFSAFPLHSLIQTQTTTINNNSKTQNTKDILPAILRMLDPHELQKYEATTPVLADWVADYNSCVDFNDKALVEVPTFTANVQNGQAGTQNTFIVHNTTANATGATSYHANPLGSGMDSHLNGLRQHYRGY